MVIVPALTVYDTARAHIAKGLCSGGLRLLWSQFPTGKLPSMDYAAFRTIFARRVGWKLYKPWDPPLDSALHLNRPEVRDKKVKSLSYEFSALSKVRIICFITAIPISSRRLTEKFGTSQEPMHLQTGVILAPLDPLIRAYRAAQSV